MKKIVVAGGCFWGVEAYLSTLKGITHTEVGYANGSTENPSYEQVCNGTTGFAEEYHQKYLQKNPHGYCHIPRELLEP